ncbi:MAG: hypothetical protein JXR13_00600 [Thalassovita sp.]
MTLLLLLGAFTIGGLVLSSSGEPEEDDDGLSGTEGQDDLLVGQDGDDLLTGDSNDADTLLGGDGDDTLVMREDSDATGGAGGDIFFVDDFGSAETIIRDFDPAVDTLWLNDSEFDETPALFQTEDGTGLRLVSENYARTVLVLEGVTLAPGDTIQVGYGAEPGVGSLQRYTAPTDEGPIYLDPILRTTGDSSDLHGTSDDDWIFNQNGAASVYGGEGDDQLFSGSPTPIYDYWNHYPGDSAALGRESGHLDGGAGNDSLWLGENSTGVGGTGEDVFHTVVRHSDVTAPGATVLDFDPDEDSIEIDFAGPWTISEGGFTVAEVVAGLDLTYDAVADTTTISIGDVDAMTVNGDLTGASVAILETPNDTHWLRDGVSYEGLWYDANGALIDSTQGQAADIILRSRNWMDVNGEDS